MQLHANLIAGCVPRASTDPTAAAYLAATEALDTERIHILTSLTDSRVFYFAAPSKELTNGITSTKLAAAFPTHPAHQGDGCYLEYSGSDAALVVKEGDSFLAMFDSAEAIQAARTTFDLPVHDVSQLDVEAWPLETKSGIAKKAASKWATRVQLASTVWAVVSSVVAGGLLVLAGKNDNTSELYAQQSEALVSQLKLSQPMTSDLATLHQLNAILVKAGGWIETYKLEAGQLSYSARLPRFIAKTTIDELGPRVHSEYDPKEDNIFVSVGTVRKPSEQTQ